MSKFEDLTAEINAALAQVNEAQTLAATGRTNLVDAVSRMEVVSRGSNSFRMRDALDALRAGIAAVEAADAQETRMLELLNAYVAELSGVPGSPPTEPRPLATEPGRGRSRAPRTPDGRLDFHELARRAGITRQDFDNRITSPTPDFDPEARNPACIQGLAPRQSNGPTRGNLFFADGRKWNDVLVESTGGMSAFDLHDIKPEYRNLKPAQGHLEGNVAAWMAETSNRRMVLYLNEHPCRHQGRGCRGAVQHFLPKGYELYVHARRTDGTWFSRLYEGTGKAFATSPGQRDLPGLS